MFPETKGRLHDLCPNFPVRLSLVSDTCGELRVVALTIGNSVTSVGATTGFPEQAVSFSGGGFSNYWARPEYQDSAVIQYIKYLNGANEGLYNASGRGFPDVAAFGTQYAVLLVGEFLPVNGTSCSSPTFASVVGLLNDQLIAAGKSALGWLNPWLYSTAASALNDITEGNNFACSGGTTGFNATVGWDPVRRAG